MHRHSQALLSAGSAYLRRSNPIWEQQCFWQPVSWLWGRLLARSRYERDCLVTEEYRIASEKIHGQGKTIVFLTDLHNKEFGEENSRLLETVRKVKPDAVLFGGDGMVAKRGNSDVRIPLALLTELAKEFPVYCGNGNHESRMVWKTDVYGETYEHYRMALEDAGIRLSLQQGGGSRPQYQDLWTGSSKERLSATIGRDS